MKPRAVGASHVPRVLVKLQQMPHLTLDEVRVDVGDRKVGGLPSAFVAHASLVVDASYEALLPAVLRELVQDEAAIELAAPRAPWPKHLAMMTNPD